MLKYFDSIYINSSANEIVLHGLLISYAPFHAGKSIYSCAIGPVLYNHHIHTICFVQGKCVLRRGANVPQSEGSIQIGMLELIMIIFSKV